MKTGIVLSFGTAGGAGGGGGSGGLTGIFVNSTTGNDSNNGLSTIHPVRTLAAARTILDSLEDNTTIWLAYGSTWREKLDVSEYNNIAIRAYGSQVNGLPLVAGDDIITGPWDTSVDRGDAHTNVYSQSVSIEVVSSYEFQGCVYVDGVRLERVNDLATCQSTPGTFYLPENHNSSPFYQTDADESSLTVHFHPPGSTNPNTDGKTVEVVTRMFAIRLGDDSTVQDVHARRCGTNLGPLTGGYNCTIDRCLGEDGYRHCSLLASGVQMNSIFIMQRHDDDGGYIVSEFFASNPTAGSEGLWMNCIALMQNYSGAETLSEGFGGHTSGGEYKKITAIDCTAVNGSFQFDDVEEFILTRVKTIDGQVNLRARLTNTLTDVWIKGIDPSRVGTGFITGPITGSVANIDGLRLYAAGDIPGNRDMVIRRKSGEQGTLNITRSVIHLEGDGGVEDNVFHADDTGTVTFNGLQIVMSALGDYISTNQTEASFLSDFTGSNNAIDLGTNIVEYGNGNDTVANFITTNETGSAVVSDLVFADPLNGNWTATGTSIPAASGLLRSNVEYLDTPDSLLEAKIWLINYIGGVSFPKFQAAS
jgi:hypothetical protein